MGNGLLKNLLENLVNLDVTIVSGLALGIDSIAHRNGFRRKWQNNWGFRKWIGYSLS